MFYLEVHQRFERVNKICKRDVSDKVSNTFQVFGKVSGDLRNLCKLSIETQVSRNKEGQDREFPQVQLSLFMLSSKLHLPTMPSFAQLLKA